MTEAPFDLAVEGVSVAYANGHLALRDASFHLSGGTICALVGVNGSGKSTLFKSIMGFVKPVSGHVTINGAAVKVALKRNVVAYVPQDEQVPWDFPLRVWDVVMMGRYGHMNWLRMPKTQDRRLVRESLERVGMREFHQRQIGELSGGQKKRAFLARALAQQGKVILLDEPFTGVDVKTEKSIIDLLIQLRAEGHTILISTHDLASISTFCDRTILINRTILAAGKTEETFTEDNLVMTFGGLPLSSLQQLSCPLPTTEGIAS